MTHADARPSPQRDYFTYADLARELGHSIDWVKRRMPEFEARGFPAPAPWWRREKRWSAPAVRRWINEQELRAGSHGAPNLNVIQGGVS